MTKVMCRDYVCDNPNVTLWFSWFGINFKCFNLRDLLLQRWFFRFNRFSFTLCHFIWQRNWSIYFHLQIPINCSLCAFMMCMQQRCITIIHQIEIGFRNVGRWRLHMSLEDIVKLLLTVYIAFKLMFNLCNFSFSTRGLSYTRISCELKTNPLVINQMSSTLTKNRNKTSKQAETPEHGKSILLVCGSFRSLSTICNQAQS